MTIINIVLTALTALLVLASVFSSKISAIHKPRKEAEGLSHICAALEKPIVHWTILALIIALAAFVRLYKLDEIYSGIHVDEAAAAYDAWSLMQYGTDRYLYSYPVYLTNFGGGQSALFAYLVALSYRIFGGFSVFAVRFVGAFWGTAAVAGIYALTRQLCNKSWGLFGAFLACIFPVFISNSRFPADCYLMQSFLAIALAVFVRAIKTGKARWFILSGVSFGLLLYTYAIAYIMLPVFLLLCVVWLFSNKKLDVKRLLCIALPLAVLAIPLILLIAINKGWVAEISTPFFSIPKMPEYRGEEVSLANLGTNFLKLYTLLLEDAHPYNALPEYYTMYLMSIPLVLHGICLSVKSSVYAKKNGTLDCETVMLFAFVGCLVSALLASSINIYRVNAVYVCLLWFVLVSVREIAKALPLGAAALGAGYVLCFAMYCSYYFGSFNRDYETLEYVQRNGVEAYSYAKERFPDRQLYFTALQPDFYKYAYIYPLLADLEDPYVFQETFVDKWSSNEYGNNHFYLPIQLLSDGSLFYEIYDDAVYVLNTNYATETFNSCDAALIEAGFTKEEMVPYNIYYKD